VKSDGIEETNEAEAAGAESGVHAASERVLSSSGLVTTCHEILNAMSSLAMNVEYLAQGVPKLGPDLAAAAEDARHGVRQVSELVRALQAEARKAS